MSEPKLSKKNIKALAEVAAISLSPREEEHFSGQIEELENHLAAAMDVCNELTPSEL